MASTTSFIDKARSNAQETPNKTFASWYDIHGHANKSYTFGELWEEAGVIAYYLRQVWGVQKGEKVVLCYSFGLHFFAAFVGCLRAGVVAVLVYPPYPPLTKTLPKMNKVVRDCKPKLILTDYKVRLARQLDIMSKSSGLWPSLDFKCTDNLVSKGVFGRKQCLVYDEKDSSEDTLAFLQYTSGSTGDPKGVMVTGKAFNSNVEYIYKIQKRACHRDGLPYTPKEVSTFTWCPQYHDMGLVLGICVPFALGQRLHMMSPLDFVQNPCLWVELMSRHKVNFTMGPNFSFDLVARKFQEKYGKKAGGTTNLDLSHLHSLINGAEPIRQITMHHFESVFG